MKCCGIGKADYKAFRRAFTVLYKKNFFYDAYYIYIENIVSHEFFLLH